MTGTMGILNVGAGDTKLVFDKSNPAETIRAGRIVKDMLRRGYALIIQTGINADANPVWQRALDFDPERSEYIIADLDPVAAQKADETEAREKAAEQAHAEGQAGASAAATTLATEGAPGKRGRPRGTKRIAASSTRGTAVARSAGG